MALPEVSPVSLLEKYRQDSCSLRKVMFLTVLKLLASFLKLLPYSLKRLLILLTQRICFLTLRQTFLK